MFEPQTSNVSHNISPAIVCHMNIPFSSPEAYESWSILLLDDTGEVPSFEWRGWWFDFRIEIFSILDRN